VRDALPMLTDRLPLGAAGLEVSPFCLGMVTDRRMVPAAFDAGINFFFVTADMHWPVYEETRRGLAMLLERGGGVRDRIVIAAASYVTQPVFCGGTFLELLAAVPALERLDLLVAGGAAAGELLLRRERYLALPYAHALGHRALGASFHERATALTAIEQRLADLVFLRYNPEHPGARDEVFARLRGAPATRPLVYNFRSMIPAIDAARARTLGLSDDHWIPDPSDYYRFALSPPEVRGILGSVNRPCELDALVAALARGPLDDDEQAYLIQLAALAAGKTRLIAEAS
jgi:hypothetical protein